MLKMNRKKVAALFMIFGILPQSVSFAAEKLDQYNLDEIVVTASQEKIKQELNTPATTEIFTAEDIKKLQRQQRTGSTGICCGRNCSSTNRCWFYLWHERSDRRKP